MTADEVDFCFKVLRRIVLLFNFKNPCVIVSLVLFWMAPNQSRLIFSHSGARDFHVWVEFENKKLSTDYQLSYKEIQTYEKNF